MTPAPIKVLNMEDNPGDARLIRELLGEAPAMAFEVERTDRLSSTLERLRRGGIDVVLADLALPDAKGLEIVETLKAQAPDVAIVVLTGTFQDQETGLEALNKGAEDYLVKQGIDSPLLQRSIRYALQRKQLEKKLLKNTAELARSNAEREQLELFAMAASHDLRSPLQKIISFGDLLQTRIGPLMDEEARMLFKKMNSAALRMNQLLESLVAFARVTSRTEPFEEVDLQGVVREAISDLDLAISKSRARVEAGPLPKAWANKIQMNLLFQNLIGNAIKFHKADRPPRVKIGGKINPDGTAEISVEDNGIGFEEKYAARIFRPFERLQERSVFEGSGMGLAICQRIAMRHRGTITTQSIPEQGSVFTVTLPPRPSSPERGIP